MTMKTTEDVDGIIYLQKNERIAKLERKIKRLSYMPAFSFFCMLTYIGFVHFSGGDVSWVLTSIFFAGFISGISQVAMSKADLLNELSESKLRGR